MIEIRQLQADNYLSWKEIRLEALKNHPECFGLSYEEEIIKTEEEWQKQLKNNYIFGAFIEEKLVGTAAYFIYKPIKIKHKGYIWAVYVKPEYRGQNITSLLFKSLIEHAQTNISKLLLTVNTENLAAIKIYQNLDFKIYGTDTNSLKVNGKFYDEHLMSLEF